MIDAGVAVGGVQEHIPERLPGQRPVRNAATSVSSSPQILDTSGHSLTGIDAVLLPSDASSCRPAAYRSYAHLDVYSGHAVCQSADQRAYGS